MSEQRMRPMYVFARSADKSEIEIPAFSKVRNDKGKIVCYEAWIGENRIDTGTLKTWNQCVAYAREFVKRSGNGAACSQ